MTAPLLLRPEDVAVALNVSRTRVYELIRRGDIVSVKIGKVRRITPAALESYVARLEADAVGAA